MSLPERLVKATRTKHHAPATHCEMAERAMDVARIPLPERSTDPTFGYHSKEWCQGYQQCARDLLIGMGYNLVNHDIEAR